MNRFVLTVEYPRLATIWGRKLLTLANGTPRERLIIAQTQYSGFLNGRKASRNENFSSISEELSSRILRRATAFSSSVKIHHVSLVRGSQKKAKSAKVTVPEPDSGSEVSYKPLRDAKRHLCIMYLQSKISIAKHGSEDFLSGIPQMR